MEAREAVGRIRELSSPLEPLATGISPTLRPLAGIRAVLFDVYGTLFVSASGEVGTRAAGDHSTAMEGALRACGLNVSRAAAARAAALLPEAIREAHERSRRGGIEFPEVEIRDVFRHVLETLVLENLVEKSPRAGAADPGGSAEIDPELCEPLALEYECRVNPTWPMPGARRLLEDLRGGGRVLGVISNAQFYTPWLFPAHLGREPEELGIDEELCVWSYRFGQAKPSAALFALALERLAERQIEPARVLYVGNDLRNDIAPPARMGCRTVLFAGDRRSYRPRTGEPGLAGVRADAVITELVQLPELLVLS